MNILRRVISGIGNTLQGTDRKKVRDRMWNVSKWILWEFSGARLVWEKFHPPAREATGRPAPSIVLWLLGIYIALYGIASQRFENRVDRIELRANAVVGLLLNEQTRKGAFPRVGRVQNMKVPVQPVFPGLTPDTWGESVISVYRSLTQEEPHEDTVALLRDTIVGLKEHLAGADLVGVYLKGAWLSRANLEGANLNAAHLEGAVLSDANLREAKLGDAQLEGAVLTYANFKNVKHWQEINSIKKTNIWGIKNAPDGFREWALASGATEDEHGPKPPQPE